MMSLKNIQKLIYKMDKNIKVGSDVWKGGIVLLYAELNNCHTGIHLSRATGFKLKFINPFIQNIRKNKIWIHDRNVLVNEWIEYAPVGFWIQVSVGLGEIKVDFNASN